MKIRRLSTSDIDSFFENRLRALQKAPSAFLSTYEVERSEGPGRFLNSLGDQTNQRAIFGAVKDGKVIGTIGIFKEERAKISHKATIWGMYVDEEQRGLGLARRLLEAAVLFA